MVCKNCGKENKNTNIRCEFCNTELIDTNNYFNQENIAYGTNTILKPQEVEISTKKIGCFSVIFGLLLNGIWILFALVFIGFGLYSYISEHNQTKNYDETVATLVNYKNCRNDDGTEICNAVYEYEVNGIIYTTSPNVLSNRGGFETTETVYYNPNNPSESIIYASSVNIILIVIGFIILFAIIGSFIYRVVKIKKNTQNTDAIKMTIYKKN